MNRFFRYIYYNGGPSFFVRPSGSTYGIGDGSSYDNAWAGDTDIEWAEIPSGGKLYIAGTWVEALNVVNSNVTIESYSDDPCTIDCNDSINSGIVITDKTNVTLIGLTVIDAVVSGIHWENSIGTATNCTTTGSGNQGVQHIGTCQVTYNNLTSSDNIDDGISVHDSGIIVVNGGTFSGNAENINIIATAHVTINDSPTFAGTSTYDLYVTNATTDDSAVITMNGGTVRNINADIGGRIVLNGVTVSGTTALSAGSGAGSIEATDSIFTGSVTVSTGGTFTATNCYINLWGGTPSGNINLNKCHVTDDVSLLSTCQFIAENTLFDLSGTAGAGVDVNTGCLGQFKYCTFKNMGSTQFGVSIRSGASSSSYVNNCNFIGAANAGRGLFTQIDFTSNNNIYYDLAIGYFRSAGTSIINNSCFFDCTTPKSGTVTSNNEVTGDPVLADVANNDFTLGGGSSCIGTGVDLGDTYDGGIESAEWGDSDTVPVVTTGVQAVSWNIGSYI